MMVSIKCAMSDFDDGWDSDDIFCIKPNRNFVFSEDDDDIVTCRVVWNLEGLGGIIQNSCIGAQECTGPLLPCETNDTGSQKP